MVHHGTSIPFTDDKRWILWHIWTLLILLYDNPTQVIVLSLAYKELAYLDVILTCLFTLCLQATTVLVLVNSQAKFHQRIDVHWARICQHFVGDFHWNSGSGLLCAGRRWSSLMGWLTQLAQRPSLFGWVGFTWFYHPCVRQISSADFAKV